MSLLAEKWCSQDQHELDQAKSHTWVVLNHSLDIVGPVGGPGLQGPLGCGQWKLQPLGLISILRGGEEGDKAIRPGAAHEHGHQLQSLAGQREYEKFLPAN